MICMHGEVNTCSKKNRTYFFVKVGYSSQYKFLFVAFLQEKSWIAS